MMPHLEVPHSCCLPKDKSISFPLSFPSCVLHTCYKYSPLFFSLQMKMTIYTQIALKSSVNGTQYVPSSKSRKKYINSSGYFIKCSHMPFLSLTPVVSWLLSDGSTYQILNLDSFINTNLIHNFYINYIKLSSSTCFEHRPLIFRRLVMLTVHLCSHWYRPSVKVNYCFIVLGICYHFVKRKHLCVTVYHCVSP
jgi:hypothetical protein